MEAATIDQPETPVADQPDPVADGAQQRLYHYSTWVHVGPGADDCEEVDEKEGSCDCSNPLHFHAWCRLPNQFQNREIRERALAAKARKARQLRDEETDAHAILEDSLDQLARQGDAAKDALIEELLAPSWWEDYFEAERDVRDREEEDESKPYERVDQDQARFAELDAMPEDERPTEEYEELGRHLVRYHEAIKERQEQIIAPRRAELEPLDVNTLIDRVRSQRVDRAGSEEFMHLYAAESWFVGTLKKRHGERVFATREQMHAAAPEVLDALKEAFTDLDRTKQQGASGNP